MGVGRGESGTGPLERPGKEAWHGDLLATKLLQSALARAVVPPNKAGTAKRVQSMASWGAPVVVQAQALQPLQAGYGMRHGCEAVSTGVEVLQGGAAA